MIALCTLQVDACLVTSRTRLCRTRSLKWSLCMQSGWWKGCSGLRSVINRDPVLRSPTMWLTCSLCNIQYGLTVQKIPLSLPHTQSQTHTHYCLHLYASQPPTEISPSSSRGQTIEQLICVLALTKRRSSSSICISPDAIYTLNLMCQECENSDRCSSSVPPSLTWQQQTKTRLWKPVLIATASAEQLACADI